jgi:hypothetical protein
MSDFHVQTELSQKDLARMIRQTDGWVSKGSWQEVSVKTVNHIYYDELDKIAQKQILVIELHYQEPGHYEQRAIFTPMRCGKCGRLFLAHPYWETDMGCGYKTCDRKAAEIERLTTSKPGSLSW